MKILVTCPPMLLAKQQFYPLFEKNGFKAICPSFKQVLSKKKILKIIDKFDAWVVGDDIVDKEIINKGKRGNLKAIIKWGIGTDNIDLVELKVIYFQL